MTVNMHYLCHALLFQCTYIFAGEYRRLLAPQHSLANCIQANVNKIVELNMCLLCCSIQSTKLKRNDEKEVSVPFLLPFDKCLSCRRTQSDLIHFTH